MKSKFSIIIAATIGLMSYLTFAQQNNPSPESKAIIGHPQQNLIIPVKDLSKATVVIDNRAIVIDGVWNFKGVDGKVLEKPEIISQPRTVTDKLLLAARAVGQTTVSITEDGEKIVYTVKVVPRDPPPKQRSTAAMTIENSLENLIGIPTVKVTVLDAASDFLSEAAADSNISPMPAPTTQNATTQQNATSQSASSQTAQPVQNSLPTFQPTIILEGEVGDDLDLRRALSLARAFSTNILNFIQVANPLQVRIKIQVVSVELDNDSTIGLEYQGSDPNATGFRTEFSVNTHPRKLLDFHYPFFNIARSGGGNDISVFLNLIKNKSKVKILQEPTLTILNGQSGNFRVGGMFPVNRRTIDSSGAILITTEYRPFGIGLLVTPLAALPNVTPGNVRSIGSDDLILGIPESGIANDQTPPGISNIVSPSIDKNGIIKLYVRPSISSLDFTRVDLDPVNHPDPIINERLVETRVAMKDKESLIIGGLFDENFREAMRSVPFIEKVPILGELFKNRTNSGSRTELVFILTPTIVGRKQIEEGDYPQPRLPESNQYLNESGIPTITSKPTRISASEILPRPEEKKPQLKIDAEPTPTSTPAVEETPKPALQTTPPSPQEPQIYKAEDTTAEPPSKPIAAEEKPTAAPTPTPEPSKEKPIASDQKPTEEKPTEFIPVNSFTPVDPDSTETKTQDQTASTETTPSQIQEIPAIPVEPSAPPTATTEPVEIPTIPAGLLDQTSPEQPTTNNTTTQTEPSQNPTQATPVAPPAEPTATPSESAPHADQSTPSDTTSKTESTPEQNPTPTTETTQPVNQETVNQETQEKEPTPSTSKEKKEEPQTTATTDQTPPPTPETNPSPTPSADNTTAKPAEQPSPSDQTTIGSIPNT